MNYLKALLAIVVSAAGAIGVALLGIGTDAEIGDIDGKSWLIAAVAVLGSGGLVWFVENVRGVMGAAIKCIVAFLTAGFGVLIIALDPDDRGVVVITQAEWLAALATAVLATGLVYQADGPPPTPAPPA